MAKTDIPDIGLMGSHAVSPPGPHPDRPTCTMLRRFRERLHITCAEAGFRCGVTGRQYANWENGARLVTPSRMESVLKAMRATVPEREEFSRSLDRERSRHRRKAVECLSMGKVARPHPKRRTTLWWHRKEGLRLRVQRARDRKWLRAHGIDPSLPAPSLTEALVMAESVSRPVMSNRDMGTLARILSRYPFGDSQAPGKDVQSPRAESPDTHDPGHGPEGPGLAP